MKIALSEILHFLQKDQRRNLGAIVKFLLALVTMLTAYSAAFHFLMIFEDREYSWITGVYWTLTVMSTLGFGDITFTTDVGKLFSIIVLISGIIFLLTMLPFTFIQFFYLPWIEAQSRSRTPRELPEETQNHVILTSYDPITIHLIEKLKQFNYSYVVIVEDVQKALEVVDNNHTVVVGALDDPETYRKTMAQNAALVVANVDDMMNTNIAFTVREVSSNVPILANADLVDSVDILQLAGSTHVLQFMNMMGQSLARRVIGTSTRANVIGRLDTLLIAEAPAMTTSLEGRTLLQSQLREKTGITVVGAWERGKFSIPDAQTVLQPTTVLILAGSADQFEHYDDLFVSSRKSEFPVLVLGGGRVGHAVASALKERHIDYRIVEKEKGVIEEENLILGSAADIDTLERAGIKEAPSIIVTTHDDPTNIYLTIYCRRLRPEAQIISRANLDRNVSKLHEAGADLVISQASMVASTILNLFQPDELLMLAEGLNVFRVRLHPSLVGKSVADSRIRPDTGCSVIAIYEHERMITSPDPAFRLAEGMEMILIGTDEAQELFFSKYPETLKRRSS